MFLQVRYGEASSRTYDSWEQMREGFPDLYDMSNNETSGDKFGTSAHNNMSASNSI